ncbi:MAG: hypothetical protein ACTHOE_14000 [Conexibacter sp.]
MASPPRGLRTALQLIDDARRGVHDLGGRVEALAGGSATGVDRALASALAGAERELTQALGALHAVAREE